MAFLDDMKGKISQVSQSSMQKAKDLSEIAKLNSTNSELEHQIQVLYAKIGEEIYQTYKEEPMPEVKGLVCQITELNQSIGRKKRNL